MRGATLKGPAELAAMRAAGRVVAEVLDALEAAVAPGVSTAELDALAEELLRQRGARPAFKGYGGFPGCLCASVNEEVVHGIPRPTKRLREGDLVKLDFGAVVDGFYGDAARTVAVGQVSREAERLMRTTRGALEQAIATLVPGKRLGDVGHAVQAYVEARGYSVVRDFTGHGIGRALHEPPRVPNYGRPGTGERLVPGLVLAVEPMVNAGGAEVEVLEDDWTAVTVDGRLSAHFEHTVLVTEGAPEVLTRGRADGR